MSLPDEQPKPDEPSASEEAPSTGEAPSQAETLPQAETASPDISSQDVIFPEEALPEGFTPLGGKSRLPRARRRRAHRMLVMPGAQDRAALLSSLARRAIPTLEFFVFAFLAGVVLGAAYLLDSPALLLLGILLAPLLTPWAGLTLAILTGSFRFFFLTLTGLLVASALVFLTGDLAGLAGHLWLPLPLFHANIHAHLWWPDLFLVALGATLLIISFVRSEQKPILPSILLAYGLFLPLSAGGVGMGIGAASIWPDGALVFLVHLALAILVGGITLAALRFKPVKVYGYFLPFLLGLACLGVLVYFTGLTNVIRDEIIATRRTPPTPTRVSLVASPTVAPTSTFTPTPSLTPTPTSTIEPSATLVPTPSYAVISAPSGGGAYVFSEPGSGTLVAPALSNGIIVEVLPETQTGSDGRSWTHIRWNAIDGWVLTTVLSPTSSAPAPAAQTPTATP